MTEQLPPWLIAARADEGLKETPGKKGTPRILEMYANVGLGYLTDDETAWCGAGAATWLKESGYPIPPKAYGAISFESYGKSTKFRPGAICVFYRTKLREKDWRRHVAIAISETPDKILCIGANQGNAVNERWFKKSDLVTMRWPVKAEAKELRDAGSTEIKAADDLKKIGVSAGGLGAGGAAINDAVNPQPVIPDIDVTQATEHMSVWKMFLEGCNGIGKLVAGHPWLVVAVVGGVAIYVVAKRIERNRIKRAAAGAPLSRSLEEPLAVPVEVDAETELRAG